MLQHRGTAKPGADTAAIASAFEKHVREVCAWLDSKPYVKTLRVPYHDVLRDAEDIGRKLIQFLEIDLNLDGMAGQADAALYRNRSR